MPLLAVNHHYFRDESTGRGIYPTTPDSLRKEIEKIRSAGWRIGTEEDISRYVYGVLPMADKVCILTFDDGLREQMDAIRLLEDMDASAICYVPTAPLMDECVLDVHKLQMIRAQVVDEVMSNDLDKQFAFSQYEFDDHSLAIQYRYDSALARRLKYFLNFILDIDTRRAWIAQYFASLFGDERLIAKRMYMSEKDLRSLASRRLLGSHAHAHLPLANLTPQCLSGELERSRDILISVVGENVLGVSYPFGSKSAVGKAVFTQAKLAGYKYGFTMKRGVNESTSASANAMDLMRIDVNDIDEWL
jgi:peptidoglycan/xylan/chitin deacetylase (PgdA/CDA1 family)